MGRVITAVGAGVVLLLLLMASAFGALAGNNSASGVCANAPSATPTQGGLDANQWHNAGVIVHTGQTLKVAPYGWVIAIATALQESNLVNLGHLGDRNDHDSLGLFQQRPSAGWGTPAQLQDPIYASTKFYEKLLQVPDWQNLTVTEAAQRVQISAYPNAYAKHEDRARAIVNAFPGGSCGAVSASGWLAPVVAPIVSGYRTPERPDHLGVDLGASRSTPIHAAANGVVITVVCNVDGVNVGPDTAGAPCDVDGSESHTGCGWMAEIRHHLPASNQDVVSRYCHMEKAPMVRTGDTVKAGQVIGIVGTSGNSSGPHLHFEIRQGQTGNGSPENPEVFMSSQGVQLDSRKRL